MRGKLNQEKLKIPASLQLKRDNEKNRKEIKEINEISEINEINEVNNQK